MTSTEHARSSVFCCRRRRRQRAVHQRVRPYRRLTSTPRAAKPWSTRSTSCTGFVGRETPRPSKAGPAANFTKTVKVFWWESSMYRDSIFTHPDFLNPDGRTRWEAIWDQGGTTRPAPKSNRADEGDFAYGVADPQASHGCRDQGAPKARLAGVLIAWSWLCRLSARLPENWRYRCESRRTCPTSSSR